MTTTISSSERSSHYTKILLTKILPTKCSPQKSFPTVQKSSSPRGRREANLRISYKQVYTNLETWLCWKRRELNRLLFTRDASKGTRLDAGGRETHKPPILMLGLKCFRCLASKHVEYKIFFFFCVWNLNRKKGDFLVEDEWGKLVKIITS